MTNRRAKHGRNETFAVLKNAKLTEELNSAEDAQTRLLDNIKTNDALVCFYTGFSTFFALKWFYDFLGPAVNRLIYSQEGTRTDGEIKRFRPRALATYHH